MGLEKPLATRVAEWMESTGFPLEMKAAVAFRETGFAVRQGITYPDPETGKGREMDVLAEDYDPVGVTRIAFVVECKSGQRPWVVLTADHAFDGYNRVHAFAVMSDNAIETLVQQSMDMGHLWETLQRPSRGGYALREAFHEKSDDKGFAAAMNVAKASRHFIAPNAGLYDQKLYVAFPVIVVDTPLFECSLMADGGLDVREVEKSDMLFVSHITPAPIDLLGFGATGGGGIRPEQLSCRVMIITASHLEAFARDAKALCATLRNHLAPRERQILETMKKR